MTDRELMQMALDALEKSRVFVTTREKAKHPEGTEWYDERIEALRARLAQPEPEPVAWMHDSHVGFNVPLYTAPPQREWQGLTDEEIKEIVGPWGSLPISGYTRKLFDQIETKLKEKNT